jgi:ABC-type sugar transport system ATPase subunit
MGRTGSGKTTLLEAICGLRMVSAGRILLGGTDVTALPPAERGVGFVPQDGALFQHLTVREHLEFALVIRRWPRERIATRVAELAGWLGLNALLDRRPAGLSGGETQRVALGRALSFQPRILCLDEPLSALDDESRAGICTVLEDVCARTGVTALHITHNLAEAERLADCLLLLKDGCLETSNR